MLCCGERTIQIPLAEVVSGGGGIKESMVSGNGVGSRRAAAAELKVTHTRGPELEPYVLPVTWRGRVACFAPRPGDSRGAGGSTCQVS